MRQALAEAQRAVDEGEVPVGAVVVFESRIVGRGHNQTERLKDATAHAEMIALSAAAEQASAMLVSFFRDKREKGRLSPDDN